MDGRIIQDLKNIWRNTNTATIGFLQVIPSVRFNEKPFEPRFRSYSWEFSCIIRTRAIYLRALKTGVWSFVDDEQIPNKLVLAEESKAKIGARLKKSSEEILKEIVKIDSPKGVRLMNWLFQHERIHHGKLMLYHAKSDYKFPVSFVKTWGENDFIKND